jgi:hypothetical protein
MQQIEFSNYHLFVVEFMRPKSNGIGSIDCYCDFLDLRARWLYVFFQVSRFGLLSVVFMLALRALIEKHSFSMSVQPL